MADNNTTPMTAEDMMMGMNSSTELTDSTDNTQEPEGVAAETDTNSEVDDEELAEDKSTEVDESSAQSEDEEEDEEGDEDEEDDLSWDEDDKEDSEVKPEVKAEAKNFEAVAKALGKDIKSEQDIIAHINEVKEQAAQEVYKDVPQQLRDAIELAKQGGDYSEFLGIANQDYSAYSHRDLLAHDLRSFFPEGEEGDAELEEHLDGLTETQLRIQGEQVRKSLNTAKETKLNAIKEKAQEEKRQNDVRLREILDKAKTLGGMPVGAKHKQAIFDMVSQGQLMQNLFYGNDGKLDFNKLANVAFEAKYGDKAKAFRERNVKVSTKKEILKKTQNVDLKKSAKAPKQEQSMSGLDALMQQYKQSI